MTQNRSPSLVFAQRTDLTLTTLILGGFCLLASTVVFLYPIEIETRESAVWLHVLTLKAGISLYDHSQVAFVEMQKGPLDALLKLAISKVLPFLQSWQVIRLPVLILPYGFVAIAWSTVQGKTQGEKRSRGLAAICLGSIGYIMLLITAKEFLFVGRPDATAALLFLALVYVSLKPLSNHRFQQIGHGILSGVLATAVILTNWRVTPTVLVILGFQLWQYFRQNKRSQVLVYLVAYVIATGSLWLLMLGGLFEFDLALFWRHHVGFFSAASGWGAATEGRGSLAAFALSLLNPHAAPERLKGGPLLIAIAVYALVPKKRLLNNRAWLLLLALSFISNAIPYYLNYQGGGAWYFIPFVIVLWFFFLSNYSQINANRLRALGLVLILLLLVNHRTVISPTLKRIVSMRQAREFVMTARSLQTDHSILSEDTFLFETAYQGDLIDSGDEVAAIYERGFLGQGFNQTARKHFTQLQNSPPEYIISGFTGSSELEDLIEAQYHLILAGPNNFTANGQKASNLFQRTDRSGDMP